MSELTKVSIMICADVQALRFENSNSAVDFLQKVKKAKKKKELEEVGTSRGFTLVHFYVFTLFMFLFSPNVRPPESFIRYSLCARLCVCVCVCVCAVFDA